LSEPSFDHYYLYEEITEFLREINLAYPNLSKLHSIGKTPQGRDIWVIELSNKEEGNPDKKPGFYIDGNTHASEVTGSAVCIKTIWELVSGYGKDPFITNLLDKRIIYINPRVDPDGSELFLTTPENAGGCGRMYPLTEEEWERAEGLVGMDLDGDGHITQMRLKDPNGEWKISEADSRFVERRLPEDLEGPFYRIYTEGKIKNYHGQEIKTTLRKYNLNLNRNFPGDFQPHPKQWGAGPYALSEPESRAVVDFFRSHSNIAGIMTYHTNGGNLPRVFDAKPDTYFVEIECEKDLEIFKELGDVASRITGYRQISSFEGFTKDKRSPRHGCTDGYTYLHHGVLGFCMELWDMAGQAGMPEFIERGGIEFRWPNINKEDALKLLKWNDEELNGTGFQNWTEYDHPQLGKVEIGGWRTKYTWRNPPPGKFLEEEVKKTYKFALIHAALLPELEIMEEKAINLGGGVYRVQVKVTNKGFQSTSLTQFAEKEKYAKPVIAKIVLPESVKLLSTRDWVSLGSIDGRAEKLPGLLKPAPTGEGHIKTADWLMKSKKPAKIVVKVTSEKAGEVETSITLK
jgi:murein tripeptide amidase MpaA